MNKVQEANIEGRINEIEVVETKTKKSNVTIKTLKAWLEQTSRS